jgi:hypothetical protein
MSSARPLVRHFSAFSFPWAAGAFTAPGAYDAKATREQRARHAQKQGGPVNADIDVPFMFRPLRLRSTLIKNRLFVSPMCQYSAQDGVMNDWHLVHLGQYAIGGAGMVCPFSICHDFYCWFYLLVYFRLLPRLLLCAPKVESHRIAPVCGLTCKSRR